MFNGDTKSRVEKLESDAFGLHSSARKARQDLNELATRIRRLEDRQNKVRVKLVDENGDPIMKKGKFPGPMTDRPDSTYVAIEDVLGSVFNHLGMDFSIERRDPDIIRIEDEMVEFDIRITGDAEDS